MATKESLLGGLLVGLTILFSEVSGELVNLYNRENWRLYISSLIDCVSDVAVVTGFSLPYYRQEATFSRSLFFQ